MRSTIAISILVIVLVLSFMPARAQETPVVHVVFFFNPECENCHLVMTRDLPPLRGKYGDKLDILQVDTSKPDGLELYQAMYRHFKLPDDRLGTPAIVIDESVLVGVDEIPAKLPNLVEEGLTRGGINWPNIPGLALYIANTATTNIYPSPLITTQSKGQDKGYTQSGNTSTWERLSTKFKKDPVANSLAVVILVGMIISILVVLFILIRNIYGENTPPAAFRITDWLIPLIILIGLAVAGYLTYIEISEKQAICGPVGHCNEVQNSPYAKLFGILPIGVLGLIGNVSLLATWGVHRFGPQALHMLSALALWGMSLFGVAFSIYLTFLEPFVIGATCMWCLSSALVMTAILWMTTPILQEALITADTGNEEQLAK